MSVSTKQIEVDGVCLQLQRKPIKNIYIKVLPLSGQVWVSAPLKVTDAYIRLVILERIVWIKEQQIKCCSQEPKVTQQMISGEKHYLWGGSYCLEVIEQIGHQKIHVVGNKIYLSINKKSSLEDKSLVLDRFYRAELSRYLEGLIAHWQGVMGVQASAFGVKRMKTRWGSCNTGTKKVWFNLALAKKPVMCVEYVVVHELAHLLEPSHNYRFKAYMDQFMPDWRERRVLLNQS